MAYIIDYSVASLLYLGVIAWFYMRQQHVPNLRTYFFKVMLLVGFASVLLDIVTALMEGNAAFFPIWLHWLVNFIFILTVQAGPVLFLAYTLVLSGVWVKGTKSKIAIVLVPFAFSLISLLVSPFTKLGAFYIGADHIYQKGATHILLYEVAAIYIFLSTVVVFCARQELEPKKKRTIYAFIAISVAAMVIQTLCPQYLLNSTANALSLLMLYCALELPSDNLDHLTGAFNRSAATVLMEDLYMRNQPFCVQVISMKSFKTVNRQFGNKIGDSIFRKIFNYLNAVHPKCKIFRCYGDVFGVIMPNKAMSKEELASIIKNFPCVWSVGGAHVRANVKIACINSVNCDNAAAIFTTLDYIMEEFHQAESKDILLADDIFYNNCLKKSKVVRVLEQVIAKNSIEIYYQPIHKVNNKAMSLEALARIYDEELGFISPEIFTGIAEQNGTIIKLGEQILHKVCSFMKQNKLSEKGIHSVSINLSVVQCIKESLSQDFLAIVTEHGIDPHQICFEITETTSVDSFKVVRKTMNELSSLGFRFSLDDFGTGYANFQYLSELPFTNVKIDKSLLWSAIENEKQAKLLLGVVGIINSMNFRVICEGVETNEQIALLKTMGVEFHQGFYYSKPMPENELLKYIG